MTIILNKEDWQIVLSDKTDNPHHCICGHNVKRITYIYNKLTKQILCIGTTCVKKYGIHEHMKNGILLLFIKNMIHTGNQCDETMLSIYIQDKYLSFREKIMTYSSNDEIDYYDIVAPFRRLLDDVCDLVTEYKYNLTVLLKNIEKDVNSMNDHTKHIMIDETENEVDGNSSDLPPEHSPIFEIISVEDISVSESVDYQISCDDLSESYNDTSDNDISENELSYNDISDIEPESYNDISENELSYNYLSDIDSDSESYSYNSSDYISNIEPELKSLSETTVSETTVSETIVTPESHNILSDNPENRDIIELDITPNLNICEKVDIEPICIGTSIYNINICCNMVSCYCDIKRRCYKLHTDIDQLKKDVEEFAKKTTDLSKNVHIFSRIMI